jgi:uncharacterized protein (DUF924 family)
MTTPDEVLEFWLGTPATTAAALGAKITRWYEGGVELDRAIDERFRATIDEAIAGGLREWTEASPSGAPAHPKGWLALIIVLDQFTRSAFRGSPRAFAGDARATALTLEALASGAVDRLDAEERQFALMPLLHAEDPALQARARAELERHVASVPAELRPVFGGGVEQARKYQSIIDRFGRFPHRNAVLGRTSTPEELVFLKDWESKRRPR